jgi:hypothetical protein
MITLAHNAHAIVFDGYIVRGQVIERRRMCGSAVVQLETGVMPGTMQRLADKQALIERSTVMRALGANSEPVYARVHEQYWFAEGMTRDELSGPDTARVDAARQVRPG